MDDAAQISKLTALFDAMNALYIADGHHRSASGSRVAKAKNAQLGTKPGDNSWDYFLCMAFPHDETRIAIIEQ